MSTMSPQKRLESKVNVIANPAKIDAQKLNANTQLPGDILSDLQDAFMLYDKENTGFICIQHMRNILHNFGFNLLSQKEQNDELRKIDVDFSKRTGVDFSFLKFVAGYRWNKNGNNAEAEECFRVFDSRGRGFINMKDLENVLGEYLEQVNDAELTELMNECDKNGTGSITVKEFK